MGQEPVEQRGQTDVVGIAVTGRRPVFPHCGERRQLLGVDAGGHVDDKWRAAECRRALQATPDDQLPDRELPDRPVAVGRLAPRQPAGHQAGHDLLDQPQDLRGDQVALGEHVDHRAIACQPVAHEPAGLLHALARIT
ncbi:MAG TPA: hypothetical protein VHW04_10835 [Solirubrobacteraceae bacterium]|nr:hypothetical protein [Solirubrobacteraceae bacterium]